MEVKKKQKGRTLTRTIGKRYDGMMARCYRPSDSGFKRYGANGIRVAAEWIKDINAYRSWFLSEVARAGLTPEQFVLESDRWHVDRIDGTGHYTPHNCRLVLVQANIRNRKGVKREFEAADGTVIDLDRL